MCTYIPGVYREVTYYKGNWATDNSVYTYIIWNDGVIPKKLIGMQDRILISWYLPILGGKRNYNCLSVACRNSCGFQRMLEPQSILPPRCT